MAISFNFDSAPTLDDSALASVLTPPVPAANDSGAPAAGVVNPTPLALPSMLAPGGALAQGLAVGSAARKAATAQVTGSPLAQSYLTEKAKTDAANRAAGDAVAANAAQAAAIGAEPPPAHIPVPRLHELPAAPTDPHADPLRVLGQFLPILAAFGAFSTANPATNALNAATAAINAAHNKDEAALAKAHQEWLDNTKAAIENNATLSSEYRMALEDRNATMADRMAKVASLAAANKDQLTLAALRSGNPDGILKLLDVTEQAAQHLTGVVQTAEAEQTKQAIALDTSRREWAEAKVREIAANASLGKTSPNDVAGQIFAKVKTSGYDSLTPEEKDALGRLMTYEQSLHPDPIAALRALNGTPAAAAPAATPGAPAAAAPAAPARAAPAAAVTAAPGAGAVATSPPISALKDGVVTTFANGQSWTLRDGKPLKLGG